MELRDAIKILRQELCVTQAELATALHIATLTVSRWELGKTRPNRAVTSLLLRYAYTRNVKKSTTEMLKASLADSKKMSNKNSAFSGMMAVEHTSLSECFDLLPLPVYVCDVETDRILYANKATLKMLDYEDDNVTDEKCYKSLMHRDNPCEFCHKTSLTNDSFTPYKAIRDYDGKVFLVYGKLIRWNGHNAQIRIVTSADK